VAEEVGPVVENTLPQLRQSRGWSQQRLADELGVSRQTIISIEKGRYDPSLPVAFRLANVFQCTIEDLFLPQKAQDS
jgi:putative transcriptional regulator